MGVDSAANEHVTDGGVQGNRQFWIPMTTVGLGFAAALIQISLGPEFLIGAHANTTTKVNSPPMWLVSGSQLAFSIAFFATSSQLVNRIDGAKATRNLGLAVCGFMAAIGFAGLMALQQLAVTVVQDQSRFDLGARGTRSAVLLISQLRSGATWATGALMLGFVILVARALQGAGRPLLDRVALALVGLAGLSVVAVSGALTNILGP